MQLKTALWVAALFIVTNAATFTYEHEDAKDHAIAHDCGRYDAKSGRFGWVTTPSAESVVMADPTVSSASTIIDMNAIRIPQRKPVR
jgi:hypothetical protein